MAKKLGRDYGFYVASGTAPSDLAVSSNYTEVGLITSRSYTRARNAVNVSDADSGDDSDYLSGRRERQIQIDGFFDAATNAGQDILESALEDTATTSIWWLFSTNVTGDRQIYGRAIVTAFDISADDDGGATFSATIMVSGKPVEANVA